MGKIAADVLDHGRQTEAAANGAREALKKLLNDPVVQVRRYAQKSLICYDVKPHSI